MLKSLRPTFFLALLTAALAATAYAQDTPTPLPQESPWAMRPPTPQGAGTPTAAQIAAEKEAEKGTPAQQQFARKVVDAMSAQDFAQLKLLIAPSTPEQRSKAPTVPVAVVQTARPPGRAGRWRSAWRRS